MVKAVTKICNFISVIMVLIVIAIGAVMIVPKVMGNDIYAVMSGSMEPYYHVGSVVIVDKHFTPEEIAVGDPITFRKGDNAIATHRVIEVNEETREFKTKGDANEVEDLAPVPFENVINGWIYSALYADNERNFLYRRIYHCIYPAADHTGASKAGKGGGAVK